MHRAIILFIVVLIGGGVEAGVIWQENGIGVCTSSGEQTYPNIVSDGTGGAIIVWVDYRADGVNSDIYAQRIDSAGRTQWQTGGVAICTADYAQLNPKVISDGSGGAIIVWDDYRNNYIPSGYMIVNPTSVIYCQRVNSSGVVQWTTNGVLVYNKADSVQTAYSLVSDGTGGVIIVSDYYPDRLGTSCYIYGQRIDSNGNVKWAAGEGVRISADSALPAVPPMWVTTSIASDGAGGAIVTWQAIPDGASWYTDIYAQRVDGNGNKQWQTDGVLVCGATKSQNSPKIVSDGNSGAIIIWNEYKNSSTFSGYGIGDNVDIYAQRVNSSGVRQWTTDGVEICKASKHQINTQMISDGNNGAIIVWQDYRSGTNWDVYSQRINSAGVIQWTTDGVVICNESCSKFNPTITSDGLGGAVITWYDMRNNNDFNIYTQRVGPDGAVLWTANGDGICTDSGNQVYPTIMNYSSSGVIIVWYDDRNGDNDIYAQRILRKGTSQKISNVKDNTLTISGDKGDVRLDIPAGTFDKEVTLTIDPEPILPAIEGQDNYKATNVGVEIMVVETDVKFLKPMTISISYKEGYVSGLNKKRLAMSFYNTNTKKWEVISSKSYPDNNKVEGTTSHLSLFQVVEYTVVSNLTNVKVYPNPYRPAIQASVNFSGLTSFAVISIYTLSGEKVNEVIADDNGNGIWDGTNSSGEKVGSGIYLGYITDGTNRRIIKIAVER